MEYFFGIDIGGTNVKIGLVNSEQGLIEKIKYPSQEIIQKGNFLEEFGNILNIELNKHPEVKKIGIGIPGTLSVDGKSTLELANLQELSHTPLVAYLENKFPGHEFLIENDANAAALGEYFFGTDKIPDTYLFITLGTGVGGAAIINHHIFRGGDGNGMEIGHILAKNGRTLEQNIGKSGLTRMVNEMLEESKIKSILGKKIDSWDTKVILKAAEEKDEIALKVFKKIGTFLGEALVSTIRLLDIKTIIVGGGISASYDYVVKPMNNVMMDILTPYYTEKISVRKATLGNNAGILGAASLCFK